MKKKLFQQRTKNKQFLKLLVFFFLLFSLIFIFLTIAKTGLLIIGLKNATLITHENAHVLKQEFVGFRKLSEFRMDSLLNEKEAKEFAKRVKKHKDLWIHRNAAMSTLGTASYLDGAIKEQYVSKSLASNPKMSEIFGDLHAVIKQYFQKLCPDSKIKFKKDAALPGFHIFHCNRLFSLPVASVHKDLQWKRLTFPKDTEIDEKYTMSFTLALELPPKGGGLYIFESPEFGLLNYINIGSFLHSFSEKHKIEYKVGYIVVHNGMDYHMIAPCEVSNEFSRITLQGHGVYEKEKNTWWLYW